MTIEAYPLQWPTGRPRTERWKRERASFETTFARSRDDITREVTLLTGQSTRYGGPEVVISTNTALRRDGLPLAGQKNPDDPGVAVYFSYRKRPMSFACDRWDKIEHNMRAIVKTIEALRGIARWGTGDMLEEHGLLEAKSPKPTEPCGENCNCASYFTTDEWAEGVECYRLTPLVKGHQVQRTEGDG